MLPFVSNIILKLSHRADKNTCLVAATGARLLPHSQRSMIGRRERATRIPQRAAQARTHQSAYLRALPNCEHHQRVRAVHITGHPPLPYRALRTPLKKYQTAVSVYRPVKGSRRHVQLMHGAAKTHPYKKNCGELARFFNVILTSKDPPPSSPNKNHRIICYIYEVMIFSGQQPITTK